MLFDLEKMRERLQALDAEREPLLALIAASEAYQRTIEGSSESSDATTQMKLLPNQDMPERSDNENSQAMDKTRIPPTELSASARTVKVVEELIDRYGTPVPTREVIREMRERNLPIPEKNPLNVISARLSASRNLKGRRDMGWWPVTRPWPDELSAEKVASSGEEEVV